MTEWNSLLREEATRILLFKLFGSEGRLWEVYCCWGVHGQGSLHAHFLGGRLMPVRRKVFCICSSGLILRTQPVTNFSKWSWGQKELTKLTLPLQMQVLGSNSCGGHRKHGFCVGSSQPVFPRPPKAPLWLRDKVPAKCHVSVVLYSPHVNSVSRISYNNGIKIGKM